MDRIDFRLGWTGENVVLLPVCLNCRFFTPDERNERSDFGSCERFSDSDNPLKFLQRYPTNVPRTADCFAPGNRAEQKNTLVSELKK